MIFTLNFSTFLIFSSNYSDLLQRFLALIIALINIVLFFLTTSGAYSHQKCCFEIGNLINFSALVCRH